jgi:hypothetical protein
LEPKKATKHQLRQRETVGGLEKGLANLRSSKRITKKTHAGRRQEIKWEISIHTTKQCSDLNLIKNLKPKTDYNK